MIVPLKDRLWHNDQRLFTLCGGKIGELLQKVPPGGTLTIQAESKFGWDGSTGQSIFNQTFSPDNEDASDASLLASCLCSLRYMTCDGDQGGRKLFESEVQLFFRP